MASRSDLERARQKHRALLNARLALRHAWERIDYRFDVIAPAIDALNDQTTATGQIPEYTLEDEE